MIIVKWFIMFLAENKNKHLFAASPIVGYFYDTRLPESSWFLIDICTKAEAFEIIPALLRNFWLEFAHLVEHLNQEKWINMWIIFILSSTGGWAVNSLSKLHVSLATAGLNGAATVPCSDHHLSSSDVAQLFPSPLLTLSSPLLWRNCGIWDFSHRLCSHRLGPQRLCRDDP